MRPIKLLPALLALTALAACQAPVANAPPPVSPAGGAPVREASEPGKLPEREAVRADARAAEAAPSAKPEKPADVAAVATAAPGPMKAPQALTAEAVRRLEESAGTSAKFWGVRGSYDGQIVVRYNEKIWTMPNNFDLDVLTAIASSHSDAWGESYSNNFWPYYGPFYVHYYGNSNGYLFANDTGPHYYTPWYPLWAATRWGDNHFPVVIFLVKNNGEEYPLAIAAATGTANNDGNFYDWYWTAGLEAKGRDLKAIFARGAAAYGTSVHWPLIGLNPASWNRFGNQAFYDALHDKVGWPTSYRTQSAEYQPMVNPASKYYHGYVHPDYRFVNNVTYYPNRYHGLIPSGTTFPTGAWSSQTPLPNGYIKGLGTSSGFLLDFNGTRRKDYGMKVSVTAWGNSTAKYPYPFGNAADADATYGTNAWNHVGWLANLWAGPANQGGRLNECKPVVRQTEKAFVDAVKSGTLKLPEHLPQRAVTSLVFEGSKPENFADLGGGRVYYKVPPNEVLVLNYFENSLSINGFTIKPTDKGIHNGGNFVFGPGEEVVFGMTACDSISGFTVSPDILRGVFNAAGGAK